MALVVIQDWSVCEIQIDKHPSGNEGRKKTISNKHRT
jgi:hypothetical protein